MKKTCVLSLLVLISFTAFSQKELVELPKPEKEGGKPLMEALNDRHSSRSFANQEMPDQTLSNLLWAAFGINRPEAGKRTAPSSHNVQDIDIYVTTNKGAFLYLPKKHALKQVIDKDIRKDMGKQEFTANAAMNLVYASDFSKYDKGTDHTKQVTASAHCGFIGQNVYLYAASEGLTTVFRAWIDKDLIHEKLKLPEGHHVMYSQTVGYPKTK